MLASTTDDEVARDEWLERYGVLVPTISKDACQRHYYQFWKATFGACITKVEQKDKTYELLS